MAFGDSWEDNHMKFRVLLFVSGILSLLHTHLFSEEISFRDDVSENANFYGKKFSRMRSPS